MPASATWARHERPEELVNNLSSMDLSVKLKALRDVKNQIIGNKAKKLSYIKLGAVPRVVDILANTSDVSLLVQSAAAVGSFACRNEEGVRAVFENGVLPHLLKSLSNPNSKVVEACARSLKMIFQSSLAPRHELCNDKTIHFLIRLLSSENENVSEVAANLLARSCEVKESQTSVAMTAGIPSLLALLDKTTKLKQAALDALISITKENEQNSIFITNLKDGYWFDVIFQLTKDKGAHIRLLACFCILHISEFKPNSSFLKKSILSTSIKLLRESDQVGEESPLLITKLVIQNEELQNLSKEEDTILELVNILQKNKKSLSAMSAKHLHAVLTCLAAICSLSESNRVHLADLQIVDYFLSLLNNENDDVKISASRCILSLSRSAKVFKLHFKLDDMLSKFLLLLSNASSHKLQLSACEVMCNLVLNLNFEKHATQHSKIVSELISLSLSFDLEIKSTAVIALKNVFFLSNLQNKSFFLSKMPTAQFKKLLTHDDQMLQGHALGLLQNLFFGNFEEIDAVLSYFNEFLFPFFRFILTSKNSPLTHCVQTLYCLSNIASGNEKHKQQILSFFFSSSPSPSSSPSSPSPSSPSSTFSFFTEGAKAKEERNKNAKETHAIPNAKIKNNHAFGDGGNYANNQIIKSTHLLHSEDVKIVLSLDKKDGNSNSNSNNSNNRQFRHHVDMSRLQNNNNNNGEEIEEEEKEENCFMENEFMNEDRDAHALSDEMACDGDEHEINKENTNGCNVKENGNEEMEKEDGIERIDNIEYEKEFNPYAPSSSSSSSSSASSSSSSSSSSSLTFRCIENSPKKRLKRFPENLLVRFMNDLGSEDARLAALTCVVNLTWPNAASRSQAVPVLTLHGMDVALESMIHDPCLNVQNLAKRALEQMIVSELL